MEQERIGDIREAFEPYYETAEIDEPTDPNLIYVLHSELGAFQYYWAEEIEAFAKALIALACLKIPPESQG